MWEAHMLHVCFQTNIWKYLKCYVSAYMVPSVVIFLTLFVLVFLRFPIGCKSASETVGLPLLHCTVWILTRWLLPQWLLRSGGGRGENQVLETSVW